MDTSKLTTVNYTQAPTKEDKILAHLEMTKHRTNHILHLILTLISAGVWFFFWFCITASNTSQRNAIRRKTGLPTEANTPAVLIVLWLGLMAFWVIHTAISFP